ncbi:MAG TPA: sulfur reduction protein DsrE [Actinobacteria bacterium]|mgnify:CR=1|nr:sulfur reduction protein DsrE [Actinomycetota bacterium]HCK79565.1 sulfur reduction protein DsrE [Actinomycetota bacterium]
MSENPDQRRLVVTLGASLTEAERCHQAITVAVTALASGAEVSVWLFGDAVRLAVPETAATIALDHAPNLADLLDRVLDGGTLTVCTQCATRRGLTPADLLPGVRIAGSTAQVEEILAPHTQALVY